MRCKLFSLTLCLLALNAYAERRDVTIEDKSSTGRTIKVSAGQLDGLHLREAVLVRTGENKLVAARVIHLQPQTSALYIVETYGGPHDLPKGGAFNILYGIPLGDIPDLPDNIADTLPDNPQDETFFTADGKEQNTPDLDDGNYEQEVRLRPNFPDKKLYATHNLSLGVGLFRNADLAVTTLPNGDSRAKTTYQGYALRYQYNFPSSFWLDRKRPLWLGAELGWGTYSFNQTYYTTSTARILVMPLSANLKFIFELSKLFRVYPYLGVVGNVVQATARDRADVDDLRRPQLMAGGGVNMVMSESIDVRADAGLDGFLLAAVVKF